MGKGFLYGSSGGKAKKLPTLNTGYPPNATVTIGNSVTCTVAIATEGYPTSYTYQWYKNGTAVSGATSASYTFTPTTVGTTTVYCKVTNAAGTVTSRTATITTNAAYVFKEGTGPASDWKFVKYNQGSGSASTSLITLTSPASSESDCAIGKTTAVDMTNFKNLVFDVNTSQSLCQCGITSAAISSYKPDLTAYKVPSTGSRVTVTVDISSISGSRYVTIKHPDGKAGTTNVYNIYMT